MHYDVIWRVANHPRFCRGVAAIARECSRHYMQERTVQMAVAELEATWFRLSGSPSAE